MPDKKIDRHRALAVMGEVPSELAQCFVACAGRDVSLHVFLTAREALRAAMPSTMCCWFVPESLPDMTGMRFIDLLGDVRGTDRFVLMARRYDEVLDRRASCLPRTTYVVWPMAPSLLQELLNTFLCVDTSVPDTSVMHISHDRGPD